MAKVQKNVQSTKENLVFLLFSSESILTDFTLTFSHHKPQPLMYRAFDWREGWTMSLTLPSHFGSHSFPSQNGVRARSEKSEGDVRENRLPSRVLSPLYIGIRASSCEKVRDILMHQPFSGIGRQNPHWSRAISNEGSRSVRSLRTQSTTPANSQSVGTD